MHSNFTPHPLVVNNEVHYAPFLAFKYSMKSFANLGVCGGGRGRGEEGKRCVGGEEGWGGGGVWGEGGGEGEGCGGRGKQQ